MNEINVKVSKEKIRSCNGCFARNYESSLPSFTEKVDLLFEVNIRNQQSCLCEKCLNSLHDAILSVIRKDDKK